MYLWLQSINQSSIEGVCCTRSASSLLTLTPLLGVVRFSSSAPTEYLLSYIITKSGDEINILDVYCINYIR